MIFVAEETANFHTRKKLKRTGQNVFLPGALFSLQVLLCRRKGAYGSGRQTILYARIPAYNSLILPWVGRKRRVTSA